jgi:hypothetical protein
MPFTYQEPQENDYQPLAEGDYHFNIIGVSATYHNNNGNFILPIEINLLGTDRKLKCWLAAGISKKDGKSFDMISPLLKCIRRNPAVGEEPDFSSRNLLGATGVAHVKEKLYEGDNPKYDGMTFPAVAWWVYDKLKAGATISGGKDAKPATYNQPLPDQDGIPF